MLPILIVGLVLTQSSQPIKTSAPAPELWVQPVGSVLFAIGGQAHVSLGATIAIHDQWNLVIGAATTIGTAAAVDAGGPAQQFWLSVAPVRVWSGRGDGSGFFLGPKMTLSLLHSTGVGWEVCDSKCMNITWHQEPDQVSFGMQVGLELGYRFQIGHFVVSLIGPGPEVGFAVNWSGLAFTTALGYLGGSPVHGAVSPVIGFNLNILRLGASF